MSLSFLAPLFLAGAGLLAVPYLIHQIRRPEREPLRFSSLMFVPNIPKEIIERRRIQHILLMLLRMLLLLLLAFAFSRPFWKASAAIDEEEERPERHVILLDTSYSMGVSGVFGRAKAKALEVLNDIDASDRVGIVSFARVPHVLSRVYSSDDSDVGSHERARLAIEGVALTEEATAYVPALQLARTLLGEGYEDPESTNERLVVTVISDFQKSGMPERHTGWKLPPSIELYALPIAEASASNMALTDLGVRKGQGTGVRILGKVRNWSEINADDIPVKLFVDGDQVAENTLSVKAGNATQTSFSIVHDGKTPIEGRLELADDALSIDNTRYFAWHPPRRRPILLVADERPGQRWPAVHFFSQALLGTADRVWDASTTAQAEWTEAMANPVRHPSVVVACGLSGLDPVVEQELLDYANAGGQVLLVLNGSLDTDQLNAGLLGAIGLRTEGLKHSRPSVARYEVLSWLDLGHRIFTPFSGTRFNDFSALRFFNHSEVEVLPGDNQPKVLARFDDDAPAIIEATVGEGRLMLWAFDVDLNSTNLPKNVRFVPLLHETLGYLADLTVETTARLVGDWITGRSLAMDPSGTSIIQRSGERDSTEIDALTAESDALVMAHAGLFRSRAPGESDWSHIEAVNVNAAESDTRPIAASEFELKLASAPVFVQETLDAQTNNAGIWREASVVKSEYGVLVLAAMCAFLLAESWYMCHLNR